MRYDLAEKRGVSYESRQKAREGSRMDTYHWVSSNLGQEALAKVVWESLVIDDLTMAINDHTEVMRQSNKSSDYLSKVVKWATVIMAFCAVLQLLPHNVGAQQSTERIPVTQNCGICSGS
jgi:hypothetical protein